MRSLTLRFGLLLFLICTALTAIAEPPGTAFTYQGHLEDNGEPLNGQVDLNFLLYELESEGVPIYPYFVHDVTVTNGVFTVELDFGNVFIYTARWLEIQVRSPHDPTDTGDFTTLAPRQPLTATPYALQTRNLFVDGGGRLGIGTTEPTFKLHVVAGTSSTGAGIGGILAKSSGFISIWGINEKEDGTAVRGDSRPYTGVTYAGKFSVSSPDGYAGYFEGGLNYFEGKVGIGTESPFHQLHVETTGNYAVYGKNRSTTGAAFAGYFIGDADEGGGIFGYAWSPTGRTYGVRGQNRSPEGIGVYAWASNITGTTYGLYGKSSSPDGYAGYFVGARNYFEGNVGIGTDSPTAKLELGGANANIVIHEDGGSPFIEIGDDSTARAYLQWFSPLNRLLLYSSAHAYPIAIGPTGSGGIFIGTENNGSNVGINTEAPAFKLHVNGTAGKTGGGSWSTVSDRRLKKNINDLSGSLDRLMQLRSVSFEYKDPTSIKELPGRHIGMIAQEVEAIFPEWVSEGRNGYKTLAFSGFEALTVNALRELRQEKDRELAEQLAIRDEQIKALRAVNADLESRLSRLETLFSKGSVNVSRK